MGYLFLTIAIICEVAGTAALKASEEFTKPIPSLIVVAGYAIAFVCLALTLRTIPVGIAYAIWAGCGIVLVALVSYALFGQKLDAPGHRRHRPDHRGRGGGQRLLGQRGAVGALGWVDPGRLGQASAMTQHKSQSQGCWVSASLDPTCTSGAQQKARSRRVAGCGLNWLAGNYRARRMAGSHSQVWLMQAPPLQWLDAAAGEVEAVEGPVAQ